ncbi:VOC family protein [Pelagibacterium montanilacus]|uniref:VOC family protein n=1 Tax=Pelagibacterium montanilacus TaxID=2185280 RepID=UPI000F8DED93|nr:VOC family protein [Pelagibacterium montanilacus]
MARAIGIGGVFFRSEQTEAMAQWYQEHLGVEGFWFQQAGPTVFAPFARDSDYFGAEHSYMLNFRVDDLDALISQLEGAGIPVETRPDWDTPETGRFARIHDPEGRPIELWEPPAGAPGAQ